MNPELIDFVYKLGWFAVGVAGIGIAYHMIKELKSVSHYHYKAK